jgi:NAD(P)-dependent dehydrogenase (short-subunit alcohol dehydrogenase family)
MLCEDKVAIVTGAAGKGIGRSIALTLAREGARVIVNYLTSETSAQSIVNYIVRKGGQAVAVQADVFAQDGCKHLVTSALDQFGQVDICVIGPGGGWHPESPDKLDVTGALADLHADIAPIFYLMPLVLPSMYARNWGRLVGIALHPTKLPPAYAYNVGKAARAEAFRLAQDPAWTNGVTINTVAPGPISQIETIDEAIDQCNHGESWKTRKDISPQDVAEGVAFLCSEKANYITGCVMPYMFKG